MSLAPITERVEKTEVGLKVRINTRLLWFDIIGGLNDDNTLEHFAKAITEFEFTLTFANAPIDRFAREPEACSYRESEKGCITVLRQGRMSAVSQRGGNIQ